MANEMTEGQIEACYLAALDVRGGNSTVSAAAEKVVDKTNLNFSSAKMYINDVLAMLEGKKLGRHISSFAVEWYLERIKADFGDEAQRLAVQSLLIKVIEDMRSNKYLKSALKVLSADEIDQFITSYGVSNNIWLLR